jgi:predicted ATP-dependent endonuclease of OLD family
LTLEKIEINGYRGFSNKAEVRFSLPNGEPGSGLTIITGANNSGKSSIIECFKARGGHQPPSFTVGRRNADTDLVEINFHFTGRLEVVKSVQKGSSETHRDNVNSEESIYVLPSRRAFAPYFGRGNGFDRNTYLLNEELQAQRSSTMNNFQYRLFNTLKNQSSFNEILHRVLPSKPEWSIDQSDEGNYFLKFYNGNHAHSSDGLGEGIVSIFSIVDSLYDSKEGDIIVIDEPELSLHPMLQKRVFGLLKDYSRDRQIIISTHSPYFVDIPSLISGGSLVRVVNNGEGSVIYQLSDMGQETLKKLSSGNLYNPHTFGLNAKELFFLEDNIVVVEGQEDVLLLPSAAEQLGMEIEASFFGWGAGGASNIQHICELLKELGFSKVSGILDGDKADLVPGLKDKFPEYHFVHIAADDIRTKPERKATGCVEGLLDEKRNIKDEYVEHTKTLFTELNAYMVGSF